MDEYTKIERDTTSDEEKLLLEKFGDLWTLDALRESQFQAGFEKGYQEARGKKLGKKFWNGYWTGHWQAREAIALRMLENGFDLMHVRTATKLTRREIEVLQSTQSN